MKTFDDNLLDAIGCLSGQVHELHKAISTSLEWSKSHHGFATKEDLHNTERKIIMQIQQAIDALTSLSTASDNVSVKLDRLILDTEALIASLGNANLTPEQEAAVTKAQASIAIASTAGDKVDAEVANVDKVLPTPAPAAPAA